MQILLRRASLKDLSLSRESRNLLIESPGRRVLAGFRLKVRWAAWEMLLLLGRHLVPLSPDRFLIHLLFVGWSQLFLTLSGELNAFVLSHWHPYWLG